MNTINVIPTDYDVEFREAYHAFLYQWAYDMDTKSYVRLNPLPEGTSDHDFGFLGTKPTVKGLSLLKTKKNILKRKQNVVEAEDFSVLAPPDVEAHSLADHISMNVIDYVHTVKENVPVSVIFVHSARRSLIVMLYNTIANESINGKQRKIYPIKGN